MAVIKCKMCGGDMLINSEKTLGACEYCGSTMTLPKVSDEQRTALFNRGNHFRRMGEFDKALSVYESIVREDDADAEAHWCCALCRFGIEYVEDPATLEYLPTCHRASFDSILEDVDYLAALEHSDGVTKRQYQKDAAKIAAVQKGILATSQNEEPFDVFICYKETDDETKQRTRDSIDAQEIYYRLTDEGCRVFFSRITLEDKAGTEYEPYIFAALNSAKVMVAIGSKPEYFNAVWVKNEWSRFLALMRKDRSKLLIPCYKNMDPYQLPDQLSVLQSYDMTKIGFIQDLIHGVKKVIPKEEPAAEKSVPREEPARSSATAPLLKRANIFLDTMDWDNAVKYYNKVLDSEPENGAAYLGLMLASAKKKDEKTFAADFIGGAVQPDNAYLLAKRFAAPEKAEWFNYLEVERARVAEWQEQERRAKEEQIKRLQQNEAEEKTGPQQPLTNEKETLKGETTQESTAQPNVSPDGAVPPKPNLGLRLIISIVLCIILGIIADKAGDVASGFAGSILMGVIIYALTQLWRIIASLFRKVTLEASGDNAVCSWKESPNARYCVAVDQNWVSLDAHSPLTLEGLKRGSVVSIFWAPRDNKTKMEIRHYKSVTY